MERRQRQRVAQATAEAIKEIQRVVLRLPKLRQQRSNIEDASQATRETISQPYDFGQQQRGDAE